MSISTDLLILCIPAFMRHTEILRQNLFFKSVTVYTDNKKTSGSCVCRNSEVLLSLRLYSYTDWATRLLAAYSRSAALQPPRHGKTPCGQHRIQHDYIHWQPGHRPFTIRTSGRTTKLPSSCIPKRYECRLHWMLFGFGINKHNDFI